jgi:hypothetical protein
MVASHFGYKLRFFKNTLLLWESRSAQKSEESELYECLEKCICIESTGRRNAEMLNTSDNRNREILLPPSSSSSSSLFACCSLT